MTVPAFRASTGVTKETSNPSLTIPNTIVVGDLMLLMMCAINGNLMTAPTGWTFERADAHGSSSHEELLIAVFSRYATSGDPGSTLSLTIAGRNGANLSAYSGVRAAPALAGGASSGSSVTYAEISGGGWDSAVGTQANGATLTAPGATADSNNTRIVRLWLGGGGSPSSTNPALTLPATSRENHTGLILAPGLSDEALSGAGPAGTNTATNSTSANWAATTVLVGSEPVVTGRLSSGLVIRRRR